MRLVLLMIVGCLYAWCPVAVAEEPKVKTAILSISSPKDGTKVIQLDDVEGRIGPGQGWPIVFVRPVVDGEPWYVQAAIEDVSEGQFTASAHFGNGHTKPGTRFRLVAVAARDRKHAAKFAPGARLAKLPEGFPRSSIVTVLRDSPKPSSAAPNDGAVPNDTERQDAPPHRKVSFAGYDWDVKRNERWGPGPNAWSDSKKNVWVDKHGHLHMAITETDGKWKCAEVIAPKSLGYGEYRWTVSGNLADLDPHVVLGLFFYENQRREVDFELSRWGRDKNSNAQFVVQPAPYKDNMKRFDTGKAKVVTCSIVWKEGLVHGRCWAGSDATAALLADWKYSGRKVPKASHERARVNLWLLHGKPPKSKQRSDITIQAFSFTPATANSKRAASGDAEKAVK